jgi:hypothetical protein
MCLYQGGHNYTEYTYGQGGTFSYNQLGQLKDGPAFNPSARDPVYQQVARARTDNGFAKFFAWDILTAKPETGNFFHELIDGNLVANRLENRDYGRDQAYMETKHQLNASKSWVAQAFGAPVVSDGNGGWRKAVRLTREVTMAMQKDAEGNPVPLAKQLWQGSDFAPGAAVTDTNLIRLLNGGHYAFSATGERGTKVYVPWAEGYLPAKGGNEAPERGNVKDSGGAGANRAGVGPGTARPGNVIGGRQSLLGGAAEQEQRRKSLLGG